MSRPDDYLKTVGIVEHMLDSDDVIGFMANFVVAGPSDQVSARIVRGLDEKMVTTLADDEFSEEELRSDVLLRELAGPIVLISEESGTPISDVITEVQVAAEKMKENDRDFKRNEVE